MNLFHDTHGNLVAIHIPNARRLYTEERTNFITPETATLQVGFIHRKAGASFPRHNHPPIERQVKGCAEVLIIQDGELDAYIYDEESNHVGSVIILKGDVFIQYRGGHEFRVREEVKLMEIKQGPYVEGSKVTYELPAYEQTR